MNPTPSFRLVIPPSLYDAMLAHARAELPNECVGFLAGTITEGVGQVMQYLPLVNERASSTEFYTEPRSVLTAFQTMRTANTELLAIYHSHPTTAPIPSRKDLEQNTYGPAVVWVIIGFLRDTPDVQAWRLAETTFHEAAWTVGCS